MWGSVGGAVVRLDKAGVQTCFRQLIQEAVFSVLAANLAISPTLLQPSKNGS